MPKHGQFDTLQTNLKPVGVAQIRQKVCREVSPPEKYVSVHYINLISFAN